MAHGVDAFGADADAIAEFPDEGSGFLATATTTALSTGNGDERVLAFAMHDARAAASSSALMGKSPSTKISRSSTKQPYFCTEMMSASYSSPR